jgi:hypothetical protein
MAGTCMPRSKSSRLFVELVEGLGFSTRGVEGLEMVGFRVWGLGLRV